MLNVLWVFLGSGVGGGFRYLLSGWLTRVAPGFPYGTLAVNVIGSFLIAVLMMLGMEGGMIGPEWRLALTTGVMGGFTTYSTFNYETLGLFERGAIGLGVLNVAVTIVACLVAGGLGLWLGRAIVGKPALGT